MLSHLRFHRRGTSNPASPSLNQPRPWSPQVDACAALDSAPPDDGSSSTSSALPPTLPSIPSVSSSGKDSAAADWPSAQLHRDDTCIRGPAIQTYSGDAHSATAHRTGDVATGPSSPNLSKRLPPRPISSETDQTSSSHAAPATSFSTPTELQNGVSAAAGRRPVRSLLPLEKSAPPPFTPGADPPKTRKSLPFLKNSMSTLLMRRKNNPNVPEIRPLPLPNRVEEPLYDPRIRGTRVHDFSAPRRKQTVVTGDERIRSSSDARSSTMGPEAGQLRTAGSASESARSVSLDTTSSPAHPSPSVSSAKTKASSIEQILVAANDEQAPPVPPKDKPFIPGRSLSRPIAAVDDDERSRQTTPSRRNTQSKNASLPDMSALPKHMKSTSSRFSFDMIGAAGQEKLLEERHRQRELERRSTGADGASLDGYDRHSFDYDSMMDDDGLEERIPGVNADADAEDEEEDNHYYVFGDGNNRFSAASSLTSSNSVGVRGTHGDGQGRASVLSSQPPFSPDSSRLSPGSRPLSVVEQDRHGLVSGLGIRPHSVSSSSGAATRDAAEDELYFDDGIVNSTGEFAQDLAVEPEYGEEPFDESIFDVNDTDKYGRPVPGAFAQAQMMRRAAMQTAKRDSDATSGTSAVLRSTAHTSPLEDSHRECDKGTGNGLDGVNQSSMAAYQAALAAAAHEAAASGKFQRSCSSREAEEQPLAAVWEGSVPAIRRTEFGDDEDEYEDVDGLDDDAIIAEANASALAYDSDGWYGQEFGFYSAPAGPHQALHAPKSSSFEYANGGFFGPNGMSTIDHSANGRMLSREPNLTPITERSEYSNRNSLMSLGIPPFSSSTPAVQSPCLSHLAAVGERGDEQMTLSALLRLRSRAWGGSQISLTSSKDGSPRSERGDATSPWGQNAAASLLHPTGGDHGRKNSHLSTASHDSEGVSECGSPTMTMAAPVWSESEEPPVGTGDHRPMTLSPSSRSSWNTDDGNMHSRRGHHRQRSSTDSVSYLREEGGGEIRWIMERRRTGESGEVEILERELVEGGRI